jgi:hypothetical protein
MQPIEQLEAELRATQALANAETDAIKRARLDGECAYILEAIQHEKALVAIERKYGPAPVRLVRR